MDIRHTQADWLAQKGVPPSDLQEMDRWETPSMVQRYAHPLPAHLAHETRPPDGLMDTDSARRPKGWVSEALIVCGQGRIRAADTRIISPRRRCARRR